MNKRREKNVQKSLDKKSGEKYAGMRNKNKERERKYVSVVTSNIVW